MQRNHPTTRLVQANLSADLAAPSLWKTNLPSAADQVQFTKTLQDNPWTQQITPPLIGLDTVPLYNDLGYSDRPDWKQRVRFYSDKIVIYPVALNPRPRLDQPKKCINNLTRGNFKGFISRGSAVTIRKRLEAWIKSVSVNKRLYQGAGKPKHSHIVFATLTLPSKQVHGDNELKRSVLMPFFQQLRRLHGVEAYFWSSEPMENDNLHFHVLFDRYIKGSALDDLWNVACNHLGYLDRYVQATGDLRPPSTKINVCPENMSLVKYVLKYVSKQPRIQYSHSSIEDQQEHPATYWEHEEIKGGLKEVEQRGLKYNLADLEPDGILYPDKVTFDGKSWWRWYKRRPVEGRSWGMSKELTKIDIYSTDVSYRVRDVRSIMEWDPTVKFIQKDHCEVWYCNTFDVLLRNDLRLLNDYQNHYLRTYKQIYFPDQLKKEEVVFVIELDQVELPDKVPKWHQQRLFSA